MCVKILAFDILNIGFTMENNDETMGVVSFIVSSLSEIFILKLPCIVLDKVGFQSYVLCITYELSIMLYFILSLLSNKSILTVSTLPL